MQKLKYSYISSREKGRIFARKVRGGNVDEGRRKKGRNDERRSLKKIVQEAGSGRGSLWQLFSVSHFSFQVGEQTVLAWFLAFLCAVGQR